MGSFPLTRGKQLVTAYNTRTGGLIPAHAGKTRRPRRSWRRSWAHPRSRGENRLIHWPTRALVGSSPLTRGKQDERRRVPLVAGLIPAHAGKTPSSRPCSTERRAHPRSRGENSTRPRVLRGVVGSSPLTRGKPARLPPSRTNQGLIPAHAGKTNMAGITGQGTTAHPRSRGENVTGV